MKPTRFANPILHYGFLSIIVGLGAATLWLHTAGHAAHETASACPTTGQTHTIQVVSGGFVPSRLNARLCDQVTFVATDGQPHILAFGAHEHHLSYPGLPERLLKSGGSETLTLTLAGTYPIHDHLDDSKQGLIIITK